MNNEVEQDGTVVKIKKNRKVVAHIEPITADRIKLKPSPPDEANEARLNHKRMKDDFVKELTDLIKKNPVYNTHRIPAHVLASHMCDSANNFNFTLFCFNTAMNANKKDG